MKRPNKAIAALAVFLRVGKQLCWLAEILSRVFLLFADKPTCGIVRKEVNNEDVLICTATGSPRESEFEWSLKYENDTLQSHKTGGDAYESILTLDNDVSAMRTYVCVASNSVGMGPPCEIEVAGERRLLALIPFLGGRS